MAMTIRDGKIIEVKPPLAPEDAPVLAMFVPPTWGTVMYVPFDPETMQIPPSVMDGYKERIIGGVRVRYSPNVHRVFLQYYTSYDPVRGQYATKFPVLLVDYGTITHLLYAGRTKPRDKPVKNQYEDWKSGVMWARQPQNEDRTITICTHYSPRLGCTNVRTVTVPAGYWWVGYEARLLEMPFSVLMADRDVFKFYYLKPKGIVYKIPGFSSLAEYIYERKIKGQIDDIRQLLSAFGLALDETTPYTTDGGRTVTGPYVEETEGSYIVYMPVRRVGGLALPVPPYIIALIIVAIMVAITAVTAYRITSMRSRNFTYYLNFTKDAMDTYNDCISKCNGNEDCMQGCYEAYVQAVNTAHDAFDSTGTGFTGTVKELTELIKWGIVAVVVVNLLPALTSAVRRGR